MNRSSERSPVLPLAVAILGLIVALLAVALVALFVYVRQYTNPADRMLAEAGIEEKAAQVGDVNWHYAEGPDNGPTLLLLHAQTLDWYSYSRVLPALADHYHVYAVDYPGHGRTTVPADYPMTANRIGADLARFIQTVVREPIYVAGNSSGGLLAAWLAANRPDLVTRLVLEDPPLFSSEYSEIGRTVADRLFTASQRAVASGYQGSFLDYWIANGREFFRAYAGPGSQQLIGLAVSTYKQANPGRPVEIAFLPATVQEMLRGLDYYDPRFGAAFHDGSWNAGFDHAEALASIGCPTLLIQADTGYLADGTLNGAMSPEQAQRATSLIQYCQYVTVPAGHVTHLEEPDLYIQIVDEFLLDE